MKNEALNRLKTCYFENTQRKITVTANSVLLEQGAINHKLYYVCSGKLEGYLNNNEMNHGNPVFSIGQGAFIGVHSFFSETHRVSATIIATKDSELAWVDFDTPPQDPEVYGSLHTQFMPVIFEELYKRQMNPEKKEISQMPGLGLVFGIIGVLVCLLLIWIFISWV